MNHGLPKIDRKLPKPLSSDSKLPVDSLLPAVTTHHKNYEWTANESSERPGWRLVSLIQTKNRRAKEITDLTAIAVASSVLIVASRVLATANNGQPN